MSNGWFQTWFAPPNPQNPYPARPVGPNGTQQFAKLDDKTLFTIVHSYASRGFWHRYYNQTDVKQSTKNIIANLKEIIKEAAGILLMVQKEHGYTPNEIVGALRRHIWKGGIPDTNPAMRMYIVAFGIASILIEVNGTPTNVPRPGSRNQAPPQQGTPRVVHHVHYFEQGGDNTSQLEDALKRLKEYQSMYRSTRQQFKWGGDDDDDDDQYSAFKGLFKARY
jgi:hypothetical protein